MRRGRSGRVGLAGCLVLVAACTAVPAAAQQPPLAGARVDHVGLVVKDIDQSARRYAAVLGVPVPAVSTTSVPLPGGRTVRVRIAQFPLPNFRIDLAQPLDADGVFEPFLKAWGDGIQHLGVTVPDRFPERVAELVARGGRLTMGGPSASFAFVEMTDQLGTTLELKPAGPAGAAPATAAGALGSSVVSHVGLILKDVQKTARLFAELTGAPAPQFIVAKGVDFPPSFTGDRSHEVTITMAKLGDISLELQQDPGTAKGKNPWHDSAVRLGGNGVEHVAFTVVGDLDAMRRHLAAQGAPEVLGGPGSRYPHFEFGPTLGMMIELLGTPAK